VGKFIVDRDTGETRFLAAVNVVAGDFVGALSEPWVAAWDGPRLVLAH
jgi:beta-fructofuranosidase